MVTPNHDADGILGAITAITMAMVANLEYVEAWMRIAAAMVAIVAGITSIVYHMKKIKE
jgi:hypothetical protein